MRDMREVLNIVIVFTLSNIYILSASSICKGYTFYVIHYTQQGWRAKEQLIYWKIFRIKDWNSKSSNSANFRDKI